MTSHPSTSRRQRTVEFRALPSRTGQVRRIVSAHLRYWKLEALIDPAASGVTELLSCVHRQMGSDGSCTVEIALCRDGLTVSVRDHGRPVPSARPSGTLPATGHGPAPVAAAGGGRDVRAGHGGAGEPACFTLPLPLPSPESPPRTRTPVRASAPVRLPRL